MIMPERRELKDYSKTRLFTVHMKDVRLKILSAAFFHDPLFEFFWSDEEERSRKIGPVLKLFLEGASQVFTLDAPDGSCAAVLGAFAPGEYPPSFLHFLSAAPMLIRTAAGLLITDGFGLLGKLWSIYCDAEKIRPKEPHWYIVVIGVDPEHQGKNYGGRLLNGILLKADEQRVPVYLECSNPKSLDFYARHGFSVNQEVRPCAGCPPIWGVERKPFQGPEPALSSRSRF